MKNWNIARIIRLIAGIGFGVYAIVGKEYILLLIAGLLLIQAVFNISCCGAGGCSPDGSKQQEVYKGQIKKYKG